MCISDWSSDVCSSDLLTKFGRFRLQEFSARRRVEKQITNFNGRAKRVRRRMWRRLVDLASTATLPGVCGIGGTRDQLEPRNRQDARQGFAAKTQCPDPFEILEAADLAGRVPCPDLKRAVSGKSVSVCGDPGGNT